MKFSRFCGLFRSWFHPFPSCPAPRRLKCGTYIILPSQPLVVNRYFCFSQNFFPVFPAPFRSVFRRVSGAVICDSFIILTLCVHPVNTGFAKMCRFCHFFFEDFLFLLYRNIARPPKQFEGGIEKQHMALCTSCIFSCTC